VKLLVLGHDDVTALLSVAECIPLMRETLTGLSKGDGHQPLRAIVQPPGLPGFLGLMPGYLGRPDAGSTGADPSVLGVKLLGVFPGNSRIGKDAHQGVVLLLDPATGEARAVVNASAITAVRTAAVSAVATDVLARPESHVLTVIGTGVTAQWHVRALLHVRPISSVRLVGRSTTRGLEVAAALGAELPVPITFTTETATALDGADIVVTATTSAEPVIAHDWLPSGVHINAVGACKPTTRELDTETMTAASIFVDRRESALNEAGDLLLAGLGADDIRGELGEVCAGTVAGRSSDDETTVFESLGLAVEDLAAAAHVVAAAQRTGHGTWAEF
jgi:ornithine cyclodeaminase/alanine dehydrogenase-like protein (mu-crystallin family)